MQWLFPLLSLVAALVMTVPELFPSGAIVFAVSFVGHVLVAWIREGEDG